MIQQRFLVSIVVELPDAYKSMTQSADMSTHDVPRPRAPTPTKYHSFQTLSDNSAIETPHASGKHFLTKAY